MCCIATCRFVQFYLRQKDLLLRRLALHMYTYGGHLRSEGGGPTRCEHERSRRGDGRGCRRGRLTRRVRHLGVLGQLEGDHAVPGRFERDGFALRFWHGERGEWRVVGAVGDGAAHPAPARVAGDRVGAEVTLARNERPVRTSGEGVSVEPVDRQPVVRWAGERT